MEYLPCRYGWSLRWWYDGQTGDTFTWSPVTDRQDMRISRTIVSWSSRECKNLGPLFLLLSKVTVKLGQRMPDIVLCIPSLIFLIINYFWWHSFTENWATDRNMDQRFIKQINVWWIPGTWIKFHKKRKLQPVSKGSPNTWVRQDNADEFDLHKW